MFQDNIHAIGSNPWSSHNENSHVLDIQVCFHLLNHNAVDDWVSFVAYAVNEVSEFIPARCICDEVIKMNDFIYLFCSSFDEYSDLRAYEDSMPHDLLMITLVKEFRVAQEMVGVEKTGTVYISDLMTCNGCIWKIDTLNNKVEKWLSNVGGWFHMSIANDNHLLVLRAYYDPFFMIYNQDAKLVKSIPLPDDFDKRHSFIAIQRQNGEFIVRHRSKGQSGIFVSFLSTDGQMINQFRLKEAAGLRYGKRFFGNNDLFAIDMFNENVYILDRISGDWNLTDLTVNISYIPDSYFVEIASFRSADGRQFTIEGHTTMQDVRLYFDNEDNNLLVSENVFGDMYLMNTKTLGWSRIGRLPKGQLCYDSEKNRLIQNAFLSVHIWTLMQN